MLEELKQEIAERERAIYSDVVREEASAPKNVGRMADADLEGVVHGWCGDTMEVYLRLNNESTTIDEATFATDGCGATVACGSILTQIITGMKLEKAEWLLPEDLLKALGGLPEEHVHCADLAISTLQNALFNWRMLRTQDEKEEDETG
jgi:nitrogen fixation NifU-like protein